jgi:acetyltransferase-like isoleucine patch superfamily enzyme
MTDDYFVHDLARCESTRIGGGTRVWAFAHVLPGAVVGRDCNLCDQVFVENDVIVGDRVTIKSGVQLWDGLRVGDDVFIGPNVSFTNDRFPRSRQRPAAFEETTIHTGASIGAGATILPGISIGRRAMIGAGSVVTRSVPPLSIVVGNPARIVGYVDEDDRRAPRRPTFGAATPPAQGVNAVRLCPLSVSADMRGKVAVAEHGGQLPFVPMRLFMVYGVPSLEVRGEHAHRVCEQFLTCATGQVTVSVDDGSGRDEYVLDSPRLGLYVPPRIWAVQHRYSHHAVLVVAASHPYDPDDYIRDYREFLELVRTPKTGPTSAPGS